MHILRSPFGILKNIGGKIAILDLDDQSSMTFYHIEELNKVDWRYFKKFKGVYVDKKIKKIGVFNICKKY